MNVRTLVAFAVAACTLGGTAALADGPQATVIELTASNWKFTPGTITARPGQTFLLHAKSIEGAHALISGDLGIKHVIMLPGRTVDVSFVAPAKPGKYFMHCDLPYGPGHDKMTVEVDVQ